MPPSFVAALQPVWPGDVSAITLLGVSAFGVEIMSQAST